MRILYLCNKNPYPEKDGGCVCMNNSIREALRRGYKIKVLAVNSYKNYVNPEDLPEDYRNTLRYENVFFDLKVKPIPFLFTFFTKKSPHIIRFESKKFTTLVQKTLREEDYDFVILESLFMCPYIEVIRSISKAPIVLRAHNVEHKIWERTLENENGKGLKALVRRVALKHVFKTLQHYEMNMIHKVDGIAAITHIDAEFFKLYTDVPVEVIPAGFNINTEDKACEGVELEQKSLFHLGAMNWLPNTEGLNWFLENVWLKILDKHPETKLYLAGRKMSKDWLERKVQNVVMVGEVEDAIQFMCSKQIMVVPLLSGSGMRIKIVEGLTLGKAIVTTSVGAEGLDVSNGEDILIADSAEEFVAAVSRLLTDSLLLEKISKAALNSAKKYDISVIYDKLVLFMKGLTS